MLQEGFVSRACSPLDDVVGMDVKACHAMILCNDGDLLLPQGGRVVVQEVEQRIILDRRERKLQDPPDKEGHEAATTAALRVQMRGARHGHVVGKLQGVIPILVSIEPARTKAECPISPAICIDPLDPAEECVMPREELAVVVEVMDVDLEAAISDLLEEPFSDRITFLRHDLEGGLDPD